MAITPIGAPPPKKEESAWDKISKAMGFVTSAINIGQGSSSLTKSPNPGRSFDSLDLLNTDYDNNVFYRRMMMRNTG